jgi:hypothetical protein
MSCLVLKNKFKSIPIRLVKAINRAGSCRLEDMLSLTSTLLSIHHGSYVKKSNYFRMTGRIIQVSSGVRILYSYLQYIYNVYWQTENLIIVQ